LNNDRGFARVYRDATFIPVTAGYRDETPGMESGPLGDPTCGPYDAFYVKEENSVTKAYKAQCHYNMVYTNCILLRHGFYDRKIQKQDAIMKM
jgi:hypothetical protein